MRANAARVCEGDEGVVVDRGAGTPDIELGIDPTSRTEEGERLVYEVAAEVEE
jgi:hypothetical protein